MFLWDDIGATQIRIDGTDAAAPAVSALLDACTVPIAIHDHLRAGILGTGTLLRAGERHLLLTAAHLFEKARSSGNWLVPCRASGQLLSLEGAQVHLVEGRDIALIDLARIHAPARLLCGRVALPAALALTRARLARRRTPRAATPRTPTYCVAGYPAAWSRFERGYLAARRLTITTRSTRTTRPTRQHAGGAEGDSTDDGTDELRCLYGRVAERCDGQLIHTPALEGMSGAAIWEVERGNGTATLHLAGVQSAFMHSRYLRGDAAHLCEPFLRR